MRRRPPRSTRTDTLFPYTTLVRSQAGLGQWGRASLADSRRSDGVQIADVISNSLFNIAVGSQRAHRIQRILDPMPASRAVCIPELTEPRSEERSVGKECVSTCSSRWSQDHETYMIQHNRNRHTDKNEQKQYHISTHPI